MATFQKRKAADGTKSVLAMIRIKPYKPLSRTFATMAAAKAWADVEEAELRKQKQAGAANPDATTITVRQLIDTYLDDQETAALASYADTTRHLLWWSRNFGSVKVRDFLAASPSNLHAAREKLSRGREAGTVNRYLAAMRRAWRWSQDVSKQAPRDQPWPRSLMLTEPKGRTRHLSTLEREKLFAAAASDPVLKTAIIVSIATGVRQGELLRLTWKDIDLDAGKLTVLQAKNGEARGVYLPSSAVAALRNLRKGRVVGAAAVFLDEAGEALSQHQLERRWEVIRDAAHLKDFRWHDLRHSCASYLAQNGANLLQIGTVLGHKSPSVTMRYAHLLDAQPVTGHDALDKLLAGA